MQTIAINTTQNVTIEYELASVRDRIFAFVIDLILIFLTTVITVLFVNIVDSDMQEYSVYIIIIPWFFFYSLFQEILGNGQSWGKKIIGIKVVKLNGTESGNWDYAIRWAFRWIDIYGSIGSVATMFISSSAKKQRLGDIIANTSVVRTRQSRSVNLNEVLSIKSADGYSAIYPQVIQCTEEDMLVIKTVLDRYRKFSNEAHRNLLNELALKAAHKIGLVAPPKNTEQFLRTLLKDYVILSR